MTVLDALVWLSTELGSALDAAPADWVRLDGMTFVAAGATIAPRLHATIIGRPGGWTVIRWEHGKVTISEPHPTAVDAVAAATVLPEPAGAAS